MTIPSQKVEDLAKELFTMYWCDEADKFTWPNVPKSIREDWHNIAKHVLGLIIQARIDEVKIRIIIDGNNTETKIRMSELEQQLQSLNPPKER